ncbi:MAG: 2-amino-4-hydroxy-6-hydroxymethyldihydropteridine diphosphokinase [Candidatus Hydrogenedentes bacterium]|nr:2-amino-4-hydroxy-6-hydroxymethyldihydropteridine diphosphokinase [Candidatus Hydrogenedentota bacterium]
MCTPASRVYLSLGANLGNRVTFLNRAMEALDALDEVTVLRRSPIYESEPWGLTEQPKFLNMVVEIETSFDPFELLETVKLLEQRLGRQSAPRWGPRCIDIDLILWGDTMLHTPGLAIPHERFRERAFVLTPLADLVPEAVDPETGTTIAVLASRLGSAGVARYTEYVQS